AKAPVSPAVANPAIRREAAYGAPPREGRLHLRRRDGLHPLEDRTAFRRAGNRNAVAAAPSAARIAAPGVAPLPKRRLPLRAEGADGSADGDSRRLLQKANVVGDLRQGIDDRLKLLPAVGSADAAAEQ